MNVYRSKAFTRLARREGLTDVHICQAVVEMNTGLIDANLGAGLFKKRIAMPGQGKRGSWRALLGFQAGKKAFFLIKTALQCGELNEVDCNEKET